MPGHETPIGMLVRFSRLVTEAAGPGDVMQALADAAAAHLGVPAAVVLAVDGDWLAVVAARGAPAALLGWKADGDTIGPDLDARLLAACGAGWTHARTMPLVTSSGLHGVLALLSDRPIALDHARAELADALVDLAAVASGKVADVAALATSYDELRASREILARGEKLRALGQMAAGVSHDLRNILNPIGLQLVLLQRRIDRAEWDGVRETIERMHEVIKFGVDTVDQLRDFSRQAPEAPEAIELDKAVATALQLGRARARDAIRIDVTHEPADAPRILARTSELVTAVVNLVVNAIDAMPHGGAIVVRTGALDGGGWVEVADDGPGMPPEVERHVFEPFFTTKGHEGTGLGLAMVYAFVQRYGGRVTLVTAPGAGTRIRLWFPAAP